MVSVKRRIVETICSIIGKALRPHDFRHCGAFKSQYWAGSEPHLASALLQHEDWELVDDNYKLASSLEAADLFGQRIDNVAGT